MVKHGVLFEVNGVKKHSLDDFGLLLNPVEIPFPEIKSSYTEIEGGHGCIDLTESYGKVFYKNRKFPISFTCKDKIRYEKTLSDLASFLHGREAKVTFYFDEAYYYFGRVSFNKYTSDKGIGTLEFDCNFEPFKYKQNKTSISNYINQSQEIVYTNDRMEVTPTIKSDASISVTFNGNSYSISRGETMIPNIEFKEGENRLKFSGYGTITVSYQEGAL